MDDDGEILFVYGALMDPAERLRLLGRPVNASPAHLAGYARGKKRYYFVAKQIGVTTDGALLDGLTAHDLAILDEYEDVPTLYARERIASICSVTFIVPSSAVIPAPTRAATISALSTGPISRSSESPIMRLT